MSTPGVGEDIDSLCGRCGQSWHVVMAKVGDRVVKVVCKRCGSHHGYHGDESVGRELAGGAATERRPSGGARRRRPRTSTPAPVVPSFDPNKPPRSYSARETFGAGERVVHPTFGTGVVSGAPGPGKVQIVFPSGARVMACAKVGSTLERPVAAANVPVADRPPK